MAPPKERELFRVSALVPSRSLYKVSIALAEAKAMNVETVPVTEPRDEPRTHGGARRGPGPTMKTQVLAAMKPGDTYNAASLATILPDGVAKTIAQTLANLAKDGSIERVAKGQYRLASTKRAASNTNGKSPPEVRGGRKQGLADHVRALFAEAPEHTLPRKTLIDAIVSFGGSARSLNGMLDRLKAKRVGAGTYQMRSVGK